MIREGAHEDWSWSGEHGEGKHGEGEYMDGSIGAWGKEYKDGSG